jgi:hypothetical protein
MSHTQRPPAPVRWTQRIEDTAALDGPVQAIEPKIHALFGSGTRGAVLRGDWLGHALHPVLTDLVLGAWASATVLDVFGDEDAESSAQRLVATGLLAVGPTAWSGWAEWSERGPRDKRVGLVHAVGNGLAIGIYASSWVARRRGRHGTGARLSLAGMVVSSAAAYLGGHLVESQAADVEDPAY